MRVDRTCPACSAGTFSNLIVMFGWSASNSLASFFISGLLPTQEKKETSVGSVGSLTAPSPWPFGSSVESLDPPHATRVNDAIATNVAAAVDFRDSLVLTEPAPCSRQQQRRSHVVQIVWLLGPKHRRQAWFCQ